MKEEWKVYKDTRIDSSGRNNKKGALWEVSNLGNVKKNNKLFTPYINPRGYKYIANYQLHRIIAELFISTTNNKLQVDHIDGNKLNNRVDNLRWVTPKENINNPITKSAKRKDFYSDINWLEKQRISHTGIKFSQEINNKKGHKGENHPFYNKVGPNANKHREYNKDGTYNYVNN